MRYDQMRQAFRAGGYRQPNFMTPDVVDMQKHGRFLVEISKGRGIGGGTLYGCTVLELPSTQRPDLSRCFDTRAEVDRHIAKKISDQVTSS